MSLSEIHAATAAAATTPAATAGNTGGHEEPAFETQQGGSNGPPVSADNSDRRSEAWPLAGHERVEGAHVERGDKDWEGEEGDGAGAGGRARQRLKAGGRRITAGQGREADLSVRYLITKVETPIFCNCSEQLE